MSALPVAPGYWEGASPFHRRAMLSLLAFAAGDAYGFQYEFQPIPSGPLALTLGSKPGWPIGGVSDDTLLSRLSILALNESTPDSAQIAFLNLLHANLSDLRGLGPTTRAALRLPVKEHELPEVGKSNGGMMRTALCGLAFSDSHQRQAWIGSLVDGTHPETMARDCAIAMAAAVGHHDLSPRKAALQEAINPELKSMMSELDSWTPPLNGITNSASQTLLAILYIFENSDSLAQIIEHSVRLGGDTDTVCALASGLYMAHHPKVEELLDLPWIHEVDWSELSDAQLLVEILYEKSLVP